MPRTSLFQPSAHLPALDGVRGLAILTVLIFHLVPDSTDWFDWLRLKGWCGVDLFFVLSGFLITGILYDSRGGTHFFRNFYARRGLRIFPLYYAVLGVLFLLPAGAFPPYAHSRLHAVGAWLWLYASNLWVIVHRQWLPHGTNHFWSLAIEEQFYLFWPLLVFLLNRRRLLWVCAGLILAAAACRVWLVVGGYPPRVTYVLTVARLDAFAVGGLVSLALRSPGGGTGLLRWIGRAGLSCGVLLLGLTAVRPNFLDWQDGLTQAIGYTLVAVAFGGLLARCVTAPPHDLVQRLFCVWPLRWLGKYSYGLYVYHFLLLAFYDHLVSPDTFPVACRPLVFPHLVLTRFLLVLGATVLAAFLSWHLLEKRFLGLKRLFPRPEEPARPSAPAAGWPAGRAA